MTTVLTASVLTLDSRVVAEMIGKDHPHLLRDISGYVAIMSENPDLDSHDFFIERFYKVEGNNRSYRRFDITKMGCDMVANKLTGEKGVLFTAQYVHKFNEMEHHPAITDSQLSPELRMANMILRSLERHEIEQKRLSAAVDGIKDVISLNTSNWRQDTQKIISKIALQRRDENDAFKNVRTEIYKEVELRGRYSLDRRLTNKLQRMALEGASESDRKKVSKVDVIADDQRLIEVFLAVVKDFAIKYGVEV